MQCKYPDCILSDSNCTDCSLRHYGVDCHGNQITPLEWARKSKGVTQRRLAELAGVNPRLIQRIEAGEIQMDNVTARNLYLIADALDVDPRILLSGVALIV